MLSYAVQLIGEIGTWPEEEWKKFTVFIARAEYHKIRYNPQQ
jgi:hypothetical protein